MVKKNVIHIRNLSTKSGISIQKVHRFIKFNQKLWLKLYINTNTELRKNAKNVFEKDFSSS